MIKKPRVAVLGAGIMGSSLALLLARRGVAVTLFDAAHEPMSAASRWNEGKIHLGFLYSADPSLQTARRVLPGGLAFRPLLEDLLACPLDPVTTTSDDIFLCHRNSVVNPEGMQAYFRHVAEMVRQHPDAGQYLADASGCRVETLTTAELDAISGSDDIVAGFRIPERSVSTAWVADRLVDALAAGKSIEQNMGDRVTAVRQEPASGADGNWFVESSSGLHGPYDVVINALWEGRLAVDSSAGLVPAGNWSNRLRLALFIRTTVPIDVPSTTIATGPFGDIKNYNNRDFYLSWYPAGLMVDSAAISPPAAPVLGASREQEICASILEQLETLLPGTARLREHIEQMTLNGGWVFAAGQGALSDPQSTLHQRADFGISRKGSYISVDTGKYSTAPWLAHKIVDSIA